MNAAFQQTLMRLKSAGVPERELEELGEAHNELPSANLVLERSDSSPINLVRVASHLESGTQTLMAKVLRTLVRLLGISPACEDIVTLEGFDNTHTPNGRNEERFQQLVDAILLLKKSDAGVDLSIMFDDLIQSTPPSPVGPGGSSLDEAPTDWQANLWKDRPWKDS